MHGLVTTLTTAPLITAPLRTARMTSEPGVHFGLANGLLVTTFVVASVAALDPTETACAVVLAAGLLGAGQARPVPAVLGVIAWAWFTGFVENRFGELTFAGEDLVRLAVFAVAPVVIAALTHHLHHVIEENAHG